MSSFCSLKVLVQLPELSDTEDPSGFLFFWGEEKYLMLKVSYWTRCCEIYVMLPDNVGITMLVWRCCESFLLAANNKRKGPGFKSQPGGRDFLCRARVLPPAWFLPGFKAMQVRLLQTHDTANNKGLQMNINEKIIQTRNVFLLITE